MANFLTAFNITMKTEYGFNPGNGEAMTINGIDDSQHPDWSGWAIVQNIIAENPGLSPRQYNALFDNNGPLQALIQAFFKANFWDTSLLDQVSDQYVANSIYDCSVNPCLIGSGQVAQMAVNVVKPGNIVVDGIFGPNSLRAVNGVNAPLFVTAFNGIRIANYYTRVRLTPVDAQWLPSWKSRCIPYPSPGL
jgi:Glycosyl hydrolase 108